MSGKNSELRFKTITELKNELDSLAEKFEMPKSSFYEMVTAFGLNQLQEAMVKGDVININRLPNVSCLRLQFENNKKKVKNGK